jgi:hypothetical protein
MPRIILLKNKVPSAKDLAVSMAITLRSRTSLGTTLPQSSPDLLGSSRNPLLQAAKAVERRSHIERKDRRTIGLGRGRVVVYNIAHFLPSFRTPHNPVMTIKRWFRAVYVRSVSNKFIASAKNTLESRRHKPPRKHPYPRLRRHLPWSALEPRKLDIIRAVYTAE